MSDNDDRSGAIFHGSRNNVSGSAGLVVQAGTVHGSVSIYSMAETPIPQELPIEPRGFTGRTEEMTRLDDLLSQAAEAGTVAISVICGSAGVGKTSLAVRWAHSVRDRFPDGQLFVDLRGFGPEQQMSFGDALAAILRAFGVATQAIPADIHERAARYRSIVSGRRILIVLDNACSADQVRPLLPGSPSCAVVVTSRDSLAGLVACEGTQSLRLGLLSTGEAASLLRGLIGRRADREVVAVAELARLCARLPLALRIAAEFAAAHPLTSVSDLVRELTDEQRRLDLLDPHGDPTMAVRTVFSWSYRKLPPDVARAFRLTGLHPGLEIDAFALAALAAVGHDTARRFLETLLRAHLMEETAHGRYGMHDLLRTYAAELAAAEPAEPHHQALRRLYEYYLCATERADAFITPHRYRIPLGVDSTRWAYPTINTYHDALTWLTSEVGNQVSLCRVGARAFDDLCWKLAYTLRGYFFLAKEWDTWIETHQHALGAARREKNLYAEALTLNDLGLAYLERRQLGAAAGCYDDALNLFQRLGDQHGASNAQANKASVLYYQGRYEDSLRQNQQALASYRRADSRRNVAITLRSVGLNEVALGCDTEAFEHLTEALEISTELELHLDATMALNCLGEICLRGRIPDRAEQFFNRAVALARSCGSHYEEARAYDGLGQVAADGFDLKQARAYWSRALVIYTKLQAPRAENVRSRLALLDTHGRAEK